MTTATLNATDRLRERGLYTAALKAGWKPKTASGSAPGWGYPVYHDDGTPYDVKRWKACDSAHDPKYLWLPADAARPDYYLLPGTLDAARKLGVIYLAGGEPDSLTFQTAELPATNWFGEDNIPASLFDDLKKWGIKRAFYFYDLDAPGLAAADKLAARAVGSGVELHIYRLPGVKPDGYDINALWQECAFDAGVFRAILSAADDVTAECALRYRQQHAAPLPDTQTGEMDQVLERLKTAIAGVLVKRGGKPGYYDCPFPDHGPAGKDFLFNPETGQIGGCQGKHGGQLTRLVDLAQFLDIDVSSIARDVAKDARESRTSDRRNGNGHKPEPLPVPIISSAVALARVARYMNGTAIPDVEPFLAPYKPLHQFGGLARLWEDRKTALIISGSGMGKTAFVETMQDGGCIQGWDTLKWGAEWSPDDYQLRRITGWGGPSYERQKEHMLALLEQAKNVPPDKREGRQFTPDELALWNRLHDRIARWPGQVHYIDRGMGPVSELLAAAGERIDLLRRDGRRVKVLILDYAQKLLMSGLSWAELELILNEATQFGVDYRLFVIIVSQVNKGRADKVRRGELLTEIDAQQLSDQKANLILTLNPVFIGGERKEEAWINVVKNSVGVVPAKLLVRTALYKHRWTSKVLSDVVRYAPRVNANGQDDDEEGEPASTELLLPF